MSPGRKPRFKITSFLVTGVYALQCLALPSAHGATGLEPLFKRKAALYEGVKLLKFLGPSQENFQLLQTHAQQLEKDFLEKKLPNDAEEIKRKISDPVQNILDVSSKLEACGSLNTEAVLKELTQQTAAECLAESDPTLPSSISNVLTQMNDSLNKPSSEAETQAFVNSLLDLLQEKLITAYYEVHSRYTETMPSNPETAVLDFTGKPLKVSSKTLSKLREIANSQPSTKEERFQKRFQLKNTLEYGLKQIADYRESIKNDTRALALLEFASNKRPAWVYDRPFERKTKTEIVWGSSSSSQPSAQIATMRIYNLNLLMPFFVQKSEPVTEQPIELETEIPAPGEYRGTFYSIRALIQKKYKVSVPAWEKDPLPEPAQSDPAYALRSELAFLRGEAEAHDLAPQIDGAIQHWLVSNDYLNTQLKPTGKKLLEENFPELTTTVRKAFEEASVSTLRAPSQNWVELISRDIGHDEFERAKIQAELRDQPVMWNPKLHPKIEKGTRDGFAELSLNDALQWFYDNSRALSQKIESLRKRDPKEVLKMLNDKDPQLVAQGLIENPQKTGLNCTIAKQLQADKNSHVAEVLAMVGLVLLVASTIATGGLAIAGYGAAALTTGLCTGGASVALGLTETTYYSCQYTKNKSQSEWSSLFLAARGQGDVKTIQAYEEKANQSLNYAVYAGVMTALDVILLIPAIKALKGGQYAKVIQGLAEASPEEAARIARQIEKGGGVAANVGSKNQAPFRLVSHAGKNLNPEEQLALLRKTQQGLQMGQTQEELQQAVKLQDSFEKIYDAQAEVRAAQAKLENLPFGSPLESEARASFESAHSNLRNLRKELGIADEIKPKYFGPLEARIKRLQFQIEQARSFQAEIEALEREILLSKPGGTQ